MARSAPVPAPFVCYLRVYEPLGALAAPLAARVRAGLARGAVSVAEAGTREREVCLRAQLGAPARLLPGERSDGSVLDLPADVLLAEGGGAAGDGPVGPTTLVCPLETRPRAAAALVGFLSTETPVLRAAVLPYEESAVRARAEAVMASLGESATHIISATWTVPLPWFALVVPSERILVLPSDPADTTPDGGPDGGLDTAAPSGSRRCYWRMSMADALPRADAAADLLGETIGDGGPAEVLRDTAAWLRHFDAGSLVELDYGGLVALMDDATLTADTSAADVADALAALRDGDATGAMSGYRRLRDFWAGRAVRQRAN